MNLNKKERLTDKEHGGIKTHPDIGWRMLAGHVLPRLAETPGLARNEEKA